LKATPKDDDTFLYDEKGCLFLLTANDVLRNSDRGKSAFILASMALEHGGDGSYAAANLLLAMEDGQDFDFRLLLKFDSANRAHADLVIMGYKAHEIWPSKWLDEIGENGDYILNKLREKWKGSK
jgi:hypothetical protein